MLSPAQRGMLEGIAYSDDPQVTPRDRLDAIKTLAEHPSAGEDAAVALALHYIGLSDAALAAEVEGFFGATSAEGEGRGASS